MYVFTDSTLKYLLEKIKSKIALKSELDNKVDKIYGMEFSLSPDNEEAIKTINNLESLKNLKIFYSPLNKTYTFEDLLYIEGTEEFPSTYSLDLDMYQGGVCLDIEVLDSNQYRFVIYCNMNYPENTIVDFTIPEKNLSDNDFTDAAKQSLENKYTSVEASYSTGMAHIKFSNENELNAKTIDLKTGCDMFFYPTISTELFSDSNGNVTIPYAFISRSGSDIGKVTVNIKNLTENTNSENVFNVTDNGSELVLENVSLGNAKVSFTIEGDTEELKANVLGEYSTVIMSLLTTYRSTDATLVPSGVSNAKTVVSDFGNGEYEIMLYTVAKANYLNFYNEQTLTNVSYISDDITNMVDTYHNCFNLTGSPVCGNNVINMNSAYYWCNNLTGNPVCGPNVENMDHTYGSCHKLTGSPVCGPNVTTMRGTYAYCYGLSGNPVCGDNVTNMCATYAGCIGLTGSPVCGPNVTNMYATYDGCSNLKGSPVCGNNVTDMAGTYYHCYNLTGSPVCGNNVTNMYGTYDDCHNLTGSPVCGDKVTNMSNTYSYCNRLTGAPVCGPNVTNMYATYYGCNNLYGNAYFESKNVQNAYNCFANRDNSKKLNLYTYVGNSLNTFKQTNAAKSITGQSIEWDTWTAYGYYLNNAANIRIYGILDGEMELAKKEENAKLVFISNNNSLDGDSVKINGSYTTSTRSSIGYSTCYAHSFYSNNGPTNIKFKTNVREILYIDDSNLTNLSDAFVRYYNFVGPAICGPNVTNMRNAYGWCYNLTGSPVCGSNVTDMVNTYAHCDRLTGSPVCGPNVINMYCTYWDCTNLTGQPACGPNVINMAMTYDSCVKLTGNAACGPNVTNMGDAYVNCYNLTGSPACGNSVTDMRNAYKDCRNLTGSPVCGSNVTVMYQAYQNCAKLTGAPVCGPNVTSMGNAYYGCTNLTGAPVCGPKVTSMDYTYYNCCNLTGDPVCSSLTSYMDRTYYNCPDIYGNFYCLSPYVTSANECFNGRNNSRRLNIYIANYGKSMSSFTGGRLTNTYLSWSETKVNNKTCYYNLQSNIYVFPEMSVQLKKEKENNPNMYPYMIYEYYLFEDPEYDSVYPKSTNASPLYSSVNMLTCNFYDDYFKEVILYSNTGPGNLSQIRFGHDRRPDWDDPDIVNIIYWDTTNITNMYRSFSNCTMLKSQPMCGDKVIDMSYAYHNCNISTGSPVCGNSVTNMAYTYQNCTNLTGNPACGPKVTNMVSTYEDCCNLTGSPVCGPNVTNMYWTYAHCDRLTGSPVCGDKVTTMHTAYGSCRNLTGSPVCGKSVTNMNQAYHGCSNLTGSPVCGPNVIDMAYAYQYCYNLTGSPACGNKAIDFEYAYRNCYALTGSVYINRYNTSIDMRSTFDTCIGLTGPVYIGTTNNTVYLYNAFKNCISLTGNFYLDSNDAEVSNCFAGKDNSTMLNVYVPASSSTFVNCIRNDYYTLTGTTITWTNDTTYNRYYNTAYNIYIYPVDNVKQAYRENELLIAKYTMKKGSNVVPEMDSSTMFITKDITIYNGAIINNVETGVIERSVYLDESQERKLPSSISFNGATDLLTVEKLKVDNVTDASYMFNGCSNLESVCAMDWNTSKIAKADYMFKGCSKLTKESYELKDMFYVDTFKVDQDVKLFDYPSSEFNLITLTYPTTRITDKNANNYPQIERDDANNCTRYTFGVIEPTVITVYDDGSIYGNVDSPTANDTLYLYNKHEFALELPNVESASHIFDGCTNLL